MKLQKSWEKVLLLTKWKAGAKVNPRFVGHLGLHRAGGLDVSQ